VLKRGVGLSNDALHELFSGWNAGRLQSFLIEITAHIFSVDDHLTDQKLVDMILDQAKQKGTGKWTSQNAMDLGIPVPTIDMAVTLRELSALKQERVAAAKIYGPAQAINEDAVTLAAAVEQALYFSFIATYAQGMAQLTDASNEYKYGLNLETVARIWRGGCIIRAAMLEHFRQAYQNNPALPNLLLDPTLASTLQVAQEGIRKVVAAAVSSGIPVPAMSASLAYFDAYRSARLPLNLVQAQRDFFGSHTYERTDRAGIFHTDWAE
jgi:6-phosphogluconate dehydrogenase